MRVFLSHSSENSKEAQEICALIEKEGYYCFFAPRDIRSGHEYAEEIIDGIDGSDVMLLLLSERSNSSPHVLREIERAVSKKIPIVVYELEKVQLSKSMEYFLMTHQWLDSKSDKGYKNIITCLGGFAAKADVSKPQEALAEDTEKPHIYDVAKDGDKTGKGVPISVIAAAVLLVLLLVGVVVGFNLLGGADANGDKLTPSEPQTSQSLTEQSSAPATTTTSATEQTTASATTSASEQTTASVTTTVEVTTTSAATQTTTEAVPTITEPEISIELGDTVVFGRYNGVPIEWRVIKLNEDGKSAVVISDRILTMKCFDAAESGKYNDYLGKSYWGEDTSGLDDTMMRLLRGDNRWIYSNIRTWLNSERQVVIYEDQAPSYYAMSEYKNGYDDEAGFLNDFTDEELAAILVTSVETKGITTEDRVFLISEDELQWLADADVSRYAKPTPEAVEQDVSNWYDVDLNEFGVDNHFWWLRTTEEGSACNAYTVSNSRYEGRLVKQIVGAEGFGIRPAMTIDLTSDVFTIE